MTRAPRSSALRRPRATLVAAVAVGVTATAVAASLAGCGSVFGGGTIDTVGKVAFDHSLPIPPLAASTIDPSGEKVFALDAQAGTTEFVAGTPTTTWGFDGAYLGPTIVADRGDRIRMHVTNHLAEETSVHWHGMHLPARMDGGPHQMVSPGEVWEPHWTIDQPAATLWYHPHLHGQTEKQVQLGMAGMVIVKDPQEAALALPREYGVDDVPVIVQDKRFDADGQFSDNVSGFVGAIGDTLLVNGAIGPYLDVTTDVVRLRMLNASTARTYDFGFSDERSFQMIASDGGLLSAPAALTHLRLSPGERAEVLVRMAPGESVTLRSTPPQLGIDGANAGMNAGTDTLDVLQLRAAAALRPSGATPQSLVPIERWAPSDASVTRRFDLSGHDINDRQMEMGRVDETVEVGTLEQWVVTNTMSAPHSFHVHDVQFQIASIAGEPPPPELAGWKDTIYLPPDTGFRLLMRFTDYTDRNVPYMYHCHLLTHEDAGMMGQFVVVEPGQHAGTIPEDSTAAGSGSGPRQQEMSHDH
ncbi:multicopper oxidase family protein [Leifsonia sp. NPDC058230]|uniref:multicopper oxidase family protein n=1 Tax=Leifsonia sp. NPDC058230 TaxID=3346391 RepID=UPI0036D8432E